MLCGVCMSINRLFDLAVNPPHQVVAVLLMVHMRVVFVKRLVYMNCLITLLLPIPMKIKNYDHDCKHMIIVYGRIDYNTDIVDSNQVNQISREWGRVQTSGEILQVVHILYIDYT
jgi:hypothetical protein